MNTLKNAVKGLTAAGLIVLGLGMTRQVWAGNAEDTMTVYVKPTGFTYSVSIASPEVQGYDFSSVAVGATTMSTLAITVTNGSSVGQYFWLQVSNTSPDNWSPLTSYNATTGYDQFDLLGHFVTYQNGQPSTTAFSTANDIVSGATGSVGGTKFGESGPISPNTTGNANKKDLWLELTMPQQVASTSQQSMTLTVTAQDN